MKTIILSLTLLISSLRVDAGADMSHPVGLLPRAEAGATSRAHALLKLAESTALSDRAKAINLATKAIALSRATGDKRALWQASMMAARLLEGNPFLAVAFARSAQEQVSELGHATDRARVAVMLGSIYDRLCLYTLAIEEYRYAIHLLRESDNATEVASVLLDLGAAYVRANDIAKARECLIESAQVESRTDGGEEEMSSSPIMAKRARVTAAIFREEGRHRDAAGRFASAIAIVERGDANLTTLAELTGACGVAYLDGEEYAKATDLFLRQLMLSVRADCIYERMTSLVNLGNVSLKKNDLKKAEEFFQEVVIAGDSLLDPQLVAKAYEGLSKVYGEMARPDSQIAMHDKFVKTMSLVSSLKQNNIQLHQRLFQPSSLEPALMSADNINHNTGHLLAVLIGFFFITGSGIVVFTVWNRRYVATATLEVVSQKAHLLNELRDQKEREAQLMKRIDQKARELTASSLNVIQKKGMIDGVRQQMEEIIKAAGQDASRALEELLGEMRDMMGSTTTDWQNFITYFNQVHSDFATNLKRDYPHLTENDIKLAALLRLNLDTKKIAALLDLSPESAKVIRHRLRKKLNVPEGKNLYVFLSMLDVPSQNQAAPLTLTA